MLVGIIIGAALAVGLEAILISRGLGNNYGEIGNNYGEILKKLFSRK